MKIEKLKPGMTVYSVATGRHGGTWPVFIKAVNIEANTVLASWNANEPRTFYRGQWSKWRYQIPRKNTP